MKCKILISVVICFFIIGCNLFESEEDYQEFIFEIQYTNWAWGFDHSGTYIDYKGNIYSYEYDTTETYISVEKSIYTREELKTRYKSNKKFIDQISKDVLEQKKELISPAIQDQYSDTLNTGIDMGQLSYICYTYEYNLYHKIVLRSEGDFTYQILSAEADSLINWLKSL